MASTETVVRFFHKREYTFVPDPDGDFTMADSGTKARREETRKAKGSTDAVFPAGYDFGDTTAVLHYIQNFTTNHASDANVHGVWSDDPKVAQRFAVLMDAVVVGENGEAV